MSQTLRRELIQKLFQVLQDKEVYMFTDIDKLSGILADAALEVAGIAKRATFDLSQAGIEWAIAAGEDIPQERLDRLQAEQALLDEYERAMGYNPLPWTSPKLDKLRRFLVTKSLEEIRTFAAWSRREYSSFSPAKARSFPEQVIDNWPQAVPIVQVQLPTQVVDSGPEPVYTLPPEDRMRELKKKLEQRNEPERNPRSSCNQS